MATTTFPSNPDSKDKPVPDSLAVTSPLSDSEKKKNSSVALSNSSGVEAMETSTTAYSRLDQVSANKRSFSRTFGKGSSSPFRKISPSSKQVPAELSSKMAEDDELDGLSDDDEEEMKTSSFFQTPQVENRSVTPLETSAEADSPNKTKDSDDSEKENQRDAFVTDELPTDDLSSKPPSQVHHHHETEDEHAAQKDHNKSSNEGKSDQNEPSLSLTLDESNGAEKDTMENSAVDKETVQSNDDANPSSGKKGARDQSERDTRVQDQTQENTCSAAADTSNLKDTMASEDDANNWIEPDHETLLKLTDEVFAALPDRKNTTAREVVHILELDHHCKLSGAMRKQVRARLVHLTLLQGEADNSEDDSGQASDCDSHVGAEEEEAQSDSDASGEESGAASDEESNYERQTKRKSQKAKRRPSKKHETRHQRRRRRRPEISKKKLAAARQQAERLRKRRMDELRVRNEELQAVQEDKSRADKIAAKLDGQQSNPVQRLEQRVELVEKLAQKRLHVLETTHMSVNEDANEDPEDEESSDGGSEESEMELVGAPNDKSALLFDPAGQALSLLDLADRGARLGSGPAKTKSKGQAPVQGRAALRARLRRQQRQAGNWWLARELSYGSVQEHVRDCRSREEEKRRANLLQEKTLMERAQKQLQRKLVVEEDTPGDVDDEEESTNESDSEPIETASRVGNKEEESEDDEEEALAKQASDTTSTVVGNGEDSGAPVEDGDENEAADHEQPNETGDSPDTKQLSERGTGATDPPCHVATESESQTSKQLETQPPAADSSKVVDISPGTNDSQLTKLETQPEIGKKARPEPSVDSLKVSGDDHEDPEENSKKKSQKPKSRNNAWRAMLQKEAEMAKRLKKRKGGDLVEAEAEEEEEDQIAGLEDFGFSIGKKKVSGDDEEKDNDDVRADDLDGVVDELSDDEGDEKAGDKARKALQAKEEKERHKEVLRRLREGYDGRRGGIGRSSGTRGFHRFDQLVAAGNRETAKRLGLLNADELDSDDEEKEHADDKDDEDDEAALIDKMLKDRFLHRSSVEVEENFSDDEDDENTPIVDGSNAGDPADREELEQERIAKRFSKRARMQRLIDQHGNDEEFSMQRLMEEDSSLKVELQKMKNGLVRKRTHSDASTMSSTNSKRPRPDAQSISIFGAGRSASLQSRSNIVDSSGTSSLALALQASRRSQPRLLRNPNTSFKGIRSVSQGSKSSSSFSVGRQHSTMSSLSSSSNSRLFGFNNKRSESNMGTKQSGLSLWSKAIGKRKR